MSRTKLALPKSKSQTFTTLDCLDASNPRCAYCNVRLQIGKRHFINWDDGERWECQGSVEWREYQNTIATPRKRHSEPLSAPEVPSALVEFTLTPNRDSGRWIVGYELGSKHYEYVSNFLIAHTPDRLIRHLREQTPGEAEVRVIINAVK